MIVVLLMLLFLSSMFLASCAQKQLVPVHTAEAGDAQPSIIPPASFQRGMWVRAVSIASADSLARIISIAKEMHITDLYVQTVVAGYAYYRSSLLPRSQYLAEVSPPEYDPLDSLIKVACTESLRVHAWINALLVWSLRDPPDSTRHVFYTHPEWFIKDVTGRSMRDYTYEQWLESGLEGLYLDPAILAVQQHIADICSEIASMYPVVGIHLDFIRYPGTLWGLGVSDTALVFAGHEGHAARWLNLIRYAQMTFMERWLAWHNWKCYINKERKIREIVDKTWYAIRYGINRDPVLPHAVLTTAVFADPGMRLYRFAQNVRSWNSISYALIMSYYEDLKSFLNMLSYTGTAIPEAVYGIGLLWEGIDTVAFMQAASVEQNEGNGICYFDFTNLDTLVDRNVVRGAGMQFKTQTLVPDTADEIIPGMFADRAPAILYQDSICHTGTESTLFAHFLLSLSLNPHRDLQRLGEKEKLFMEYIHEDVAAFNALDARVFPLSDTLIQPPFRTIRYEFYPWNGQDSMAIMHRAKKTKAYSHEVRTAPSAMDPLSRAAFAMNINEKKTIRTKAGVYAITVSDEMKGGSKVPRSQIPDHMLPYYVSWTVMDTARTIVGDKY